MLGTSMYRYERLDFSTGSGEKNSIESAVLLSNEGTGRRFHTVRVLVTGGAGFIGSHIVEHLLANGHEVAVVDDLSSGKRENVPEGVELYVHDVRSGCAEIFEKFQPETLSHQAAQMDVRRSVREPDFDADVNILGTIRLLQSCVKQGVKRIVFASSGGAIYGEQEEYPAPEEHPEYPLSPYGVSKLAAERYLRFYCVQYGISYVALRYANVYGLRQDPHGEAGVVAIFCANLASKRPPTINGSGEQTRDYVYVGDVARANVLALENGARNGAYNIGTGIETSVNELYEKMCRLSGGDLPPKHGPQNPGEQARSSVDPAKAARLLDRHPEAELDKGLKETLRSFGVI
jgi:UDP-glucose 4-epimerase